MALRILQLTTQKWLMSLFTFCETNCVLTTGYISENPTELNIQYKGRTKNNDFFPSDEVKLEGETSLIKNYRSKLARLIYID